MNPDSFKSLNPLNSLCAGETALNSSFGDETPTEKALKYREYQKQYYQNNKEKILNDRLQKMECPYCLQLISKTRLNKHQTSTRCMNGREKRLSLLRFNQLLETQPDLS